MRPRRRRRAQTAAQAQASFFAGPPYPSRSPRAHPSGWTSLLVSYWPLARATQPKHSQRSKMHISAVTIAEFLIVVIIIMSLPKLVTS